MIQAIFFDFNGVIIDDEALQMKAYQEVLKEQGIDLTEEDYYGSLGMDDRAFVRAAFARAGKALTDHTMQAMIDGKSEIHHQLIDADLPLFPGVLTFLKASARRYELGLVSMARKIEIDYVLSRAGLSSMFKIVVSAEEVAKCKPDAECYNLGLEKLNAARLADRQLPFLSRECLAIEDAPPGIEAAHVAGMHTLGVSNTVTDEALRHAGADVVSNSLADWSIDAIPLVFGR
jgi:HAD superfamily hydrolase (TIGR01509 family)